MYVNQSTVIRTKALIAALLGLVVGMAARSLYNSKHVTTEYNYDYPPRGYGQSVSQTVVMPLEAFDIIIVLGLALLAVLALIVLLSAVFDVFDHYLVPAWRRHQADRRDRSALVRAQLAKLERKAHKRRVAAAKEAEAAYAGDLNEASNTDGLPEELPADHPIAVTDEALIRFLGALALGQVDIIVVTPLDLPDSKTDSSEDGTTGESTTDESAAGKSKVNTKKAPRGNEVVADPAEQVEGKDKPQVDETSDKS